MLFCCCLLKANSPCDNALSLCARVLIMLCRCCLLQAKSLGDNALIESTEMELKRMVLQVWTWRRCGNLYEQAYLQVDGAAADGAAGVDVACMTV